MTVMGKLWTKLPEMKCRVMLMCEEKFSYVVNKQVMKLSKSATKLLKLIC